MATNKGVILSILAVVIVLVALAGAFIFLSGSTPSLPQTIGQQSSSTLSSFASLLGANTSASVSLSGYTALSLTHTQIASPNNPGFTGKYWLATLQLNNGAFNLAGSQSSSSFVSSVNNGSLTGSQNNQFAIQVLANKLNYPADPNVAFINLYKLVPTGIVSYTDCNGNPQSILGSSFFSSTCILGNDKAYVSYVKGCQALPSAIVVTTQPSVYGYECYQLQNYPYIDVHNLDAPYINETVAATLNNVQLIASSQQGSGVATHLNASGKVDFQLRLLYPQTTFSTQPTPSQLGTIITYRTGVGNQTTGQSQIINHVDTSAIAAIQQQQLNLINSAINNQEIFLPTLQSQVALSNQQITAGLNLNTLSPYQGQLTVTPTYGVVLNDGAGKYLTPVIQIISSLPYLGLTTVQANCTIQSTTGSTFNASGTGVATITVKNSGGLAGGCIASLNVTAPFYSPNGQQPWNLAAGATHTFSFPVGFNAYINTSKATKGTFQVCDSSTGTKCSTAQINLLAQPNCNGSTGIIVNGNNCQPLTSVTTLSTTTICQSASCGNPSTTTIQPCDNATGQCVPPPSTCPIFSNCWNQGIEIAAGIVIVLLVIGYIMLRLFENRKRGRVNRRR